jgi:hypothetical protein
MNATKGVGYIEFNGYCVVDIGLTFRCNDLTEYNRFTGQTEVALVITVTKDVNTEIKFETAKMRYVAAPINVGGAQRIKLQATSKGKYDAALGGPCKITLKNAVSSY